MHCRPFEKYEILIKNGRVIDPATGFDQVGDLAIAAGRIVSLNGALADFTPNKTIDATGCIVAPGLVDLSARLREPGHEHEGMLESELAAAVAGGVTSLVCPPDTDPVLDEPGLVEMLKFRAEKLHQSRVFPLGALTRGLKGEALTEMVELTESGCVGFSQAEVPLANTQVLHARHAVRHHLWLHRLAAPAGTAPGQGRGRQRRAGHAPGPERRAGGGRNDCPAHHFRADARHRRPRPPVPHQQRRRRGAGAPGQGRRPGRDLRRQHQQPAPDRCRHRLLRQPHAPEPAAAPAARPRRAARRAWPTARSTRWCPTTRRSTKTPRPCRSPRPSPARPAWSCCWAWPANGARTARPAWRARWPC